MLIRFKKEWLNSFDIHTDLIDSKHLGICDKYINKGGRLIISKNAVPQALPIRCPNSQCTPKKFKN